MYTKKYEIWHDSLCLDLSSAATDAKAVLWQCHKLGGNQKWLHVKVNFSLKDKLVPCVEIRWQILQK